MTTGQKVLHHQIHPLKLATDGGVGTLSYYLLWRRRLWAALVVQLVPAVLVSAALIRWADLEPERRSSLGRYVARSMTPAMQGVRLAGNVVLSLGAWYRRPAVMLAGLAIVLFGWLRGRLFVIGAESHHG
ncbi:MAG TPA: hypothetical protein VFE42_14405 [Chloroflexota bacterium]|nr:hypothetical protein [Chloroflexota bacterium]